MGKRQLCSHYFYEAPAPFTTSFQASKNGGHFHGSLDCSQIIVSIAVINSATIKLRGWSASRLPRQWFLSLAASSASHSMSDSPLLNVTLPHVSLMPLQRATRKQEALKLSDLVGCCSCPRLLVNFASQVILCYWLSSVNFSSVPPDWLVSLLYHLYQLFSEPHAVKLEIRAPRRLPTMLLAADLPEWLPTVFESVPASSLTMHDCLPLEQYLFLPFFFLSSPQGPEKYFKKANLNIQSCPQPPG